LYSQITIKELNTDLGLNWYDYGARWYDKALGRWNAPDPLAEKFDSWSGYHYTLNNPINYTDPNGMDTLYIHAELLREVKGVYVFNITMSVVRNGVETGLDFIGEDGEKEDNVYFFGRKSFYASSGNRWYDIDNNGNEGDAEDVPIRFEPYESTSGRVYSNAIRLKYVFGEDSKKTNRILAHYGRNEGWGSGCQVAGCGYTENPGEDLPEIFINDSQNALDGIRRAYNKYIPSSQKKDKHKRDVQVPAKDYDFRLKTRSKAPLSPAMNDNLNLYINH